MSPDGGARRTPSRGVGARARVNARLFPHACACVRVWRVSRVGHAKCFRHVLPFHFRRRPGRASADATRRKTERERERRRGVRSRSVPRRLFGSCLPRVLASCAQPPAGERPAIARTLSKVRKQFVGAKTTLSQAWSGNCIRGPQCAFEMSMFMCPAVHKLTRN